MSQAEPPKIMFGDLDDIAMIEAIEDAFEIKLLDEEVSSCFTVGDIYALILKKFPHVARSTAPCTSAAAYYALKRALRTLRPGARVSRDTSLRELLAPSPRTAWQNLSQATGFDLPSLELTGAGLILTTGLTLSPLVWMLSTYDWQRGLEHSLIGRLLGAVLFGMLAFAGGVMLAHRLRLEGIPRHLRTMGDLATAVAATNIAKIADTHGPARERELWASLEYIIRSQLAWNGPITPESRFVQS